MARIRKGVSYRNLERPYTRVSKFKRKSFIRTTLNPKIVSFDMGNLKRKFKYKIKMNSKADLQIRDNALNSARETANRMLEKSFGATGFHLKMNLYPFHILRENPVATGAGADRFSTGMKKSFGKPIGQACRVTKGKTVMSLDVDKSSLEIGKKALKRAASKLPCSFILDVVENK